VEPLRKLLEARNELSNLMTYMDGKPGAEDLISKDDERSGTVEVAGGAGCARR
jgi:predicted component of type VI protein secretion system